MAGIVRAFPLTPLQEGMLYHALRSPDSGLYHGQLEAVLSGPLDPDVFREAWRRAAARHEVFRTFFAWERRERPLQVVRDGVDLPFRFLDWSEVGPGEVDGRWSELVAEDRRTPFELTRAPLMRFVVVRLGPDRHRFLWGVHHAVLDGWSGELVMGEVLDDVAALTRGEAPSRPDAPSYAEFVGWLEARDAEADRRWWTDHLAGVAGPTPLPVPGARADSRDRRTEERRLTPDATRTVREAAAALRVTPATLTTAAWAVVLARHTGSRDVLFGITTSERPPEIPRIDRAAGLYLSTVPIRVPLDPGAEIGEWLRRVQRDSAEARAHGAPGLSAIRRWSPVEGPELVRSLVVFENFPDTIVHRPEADGLRLESVAMAGPSDLPLALLAYPGDVLTLQLVHDPVRVMGTEARSLLAEVADVLLHLAPDAGTLGTLLGRDEPRVPEAWTRGPALTVGPVDVMDRILERAAQTPEAPALRTPGATLTYADLARAVEAGARTVASATSPEAPVGILAERGPAAVLAMLATLRAGQAYLPLDPEAPPERLAAMLEAAEAVWVDPGLESRLPRGGPQPFSTALLTPGSHGDGVGLGEAPESEDGEAWTPTAVDPTAPAYVIFTSGSTGAPKGVVVERRQLAWSTAARFAWYRDHPGAFLLLSPLHVDSSVAGIYWTLCAGGTLVLPPRRAEQDTAGLGRLIADSATTHTLLVPSLLDALLDTVDPTALASLRTVVVAGEACPEAVVRRHREVLPGVPLFNEYGPSEATVWATADELTADPVGPVTIGGPVPGARVEVVDESLRPVASGEIGELVIGGPGVARGYLGRPDLTAQRFVARDGRETDRLYRTGDRARWREDGRLEFLGRGDHQFKVRGHRVEAGEIEEVLRRHPAVGEAVVGLVGDGRGAVLTAWTTAVAGDGPAADPDDLRAFLARHLPPYMVPARFLHRADMPRTGAGKLDRRALLESADEAPGDGGRPAPGTPPRTDTERALAAVWQEVLGLEAVGVHDDFFAVGGDSLSSIRVISRAARGGLHVRPEDFFDTPTIADLAARIDAGGREAPRAESGPVAGEAPLTPIQAWFFDRITAGSHRWNQSRFLELDPGVDPGRVAEATEALVIRHDALRLRVTPGGRGGTDPAASPDGGAGVGRRMVVPAAEESSPFRAVALPPDPEEAAARVAAEAEVEHGSLDPAGGRLFRAVFFPGGPGSPPRLLLVAHHLVVDAVSWGVILEDLATLLAGATPEALPPPTAPFLAWARGLEERAARPDVAAGAAHWTDPDMDATWATVPLDPHGDPERNVTATAAVHRWRVDGATRAALAGGGEGGPTLHERLVAAVALGWRRWTGHDGVQFDVESVGRDVLGSALDVSRTVGWFTVSTPVAIPLPESTATASGALAAVRRALAGLPMGGAAHGLARHLHPDPALRAALAARPPSPLIFNYLGSALDDVPPGAPFRSAAGPRGLERAGEALRAYPLELNAWREGDELVFALEYSTALHRPESVAAFAEAVDGALVELAAAAPPAPAGDHDGADARYPLSPMQRLMLFHELGSGPRSALTNQIGYELRGPLDADALEEAARQLVARHDALRTAFLWTEADDPRQVVHARATPDFRRIDLSHHADDRRASEAEALRAEDEARPFDLSRAPLVRFTLLRLGPEHHHLLWTVHHLVADRWSFGHLVTELGTLYAETAGGEPAHLPPPAPFRHYLAWAARRDTAVDVDWWRERLAGMTRPTLLAPPPSGGPRLTRTATLDAEDGRAVADAARRAGVAPTAVILAGVALAAARRTGRTDVAVGLTVSGRPPQLERVEEIVGSFVNNVPVRFRLDRSAPLADWLREIQRDQLRRSAHEHLAPDRIHAASDLPPDQPLFDLLVVANLDVPADPAWPGITATPFRATLDAGVPLVLQASRSGDEVILTLVHDGGFDGAASLLGDVASASRDVASADRDTPLGTLLGDVRVGTDSTGGPPPAAAAPAAPLALPAAHDPAALVRAAWRAVLGVDRAHADDDFFALGGTSLQGARLLALLEERLGRPVPMAVLAGGRTLGALLAAVEHGESAGGGGPLVTLRAGGRRPPLVAVPGVRGNLLLYPPLADALGPDRPVYGLQSRGTDAAEARPDTMEAIAADFIEQLGALPEGPVHLFGLCWGAAAAFEVAAQLARRGTPPASLGLLDPAVLLGQHPEAAARTHSGLAFVRDRIGLYWDEFRSRGWRDRGRMVVEKVGRLAETVRQGEMEDSTRQELRERAVIDANLRALERYRPGPLTVPTRIFLTADYDPGAGPDPRLEWLPLIDPEPTVVPVPGFDSGDAIKSHTAALARALDGWLAIRDGGGR